MLSSLSLVMEIFQWWVLKFDNLQYNTLAHCTEVHFASFLSGGFITAIVVNSLERKLAKCTSVQ